MRHAACGKEMAGAAERMPVARRFFSQTSNWRVLCDGNYASLFTLLVLAVTVLLYTLSVQHHHVIDVTWSKRFTLASQSVTLLQKLQKPVKVLGFFRLEGPEREAFVDLLKLYTHYTDKLTYECVDPERNPELAEHYHITAHNTVLVTGYGKAEKILRLEEEALSNAILQLTRDTRKAVYFVTGHGEAALADTERHGYSLAKQRLEAQHYEVKELLLVTDQQIPAAAVLIVAGPRTDFLEQELTMLTTFLAGGGRFLLLLDLATVPGLLSFLKPYGLELGNDLIIEPNSLFQILGGDYLMPAVMTYAEHHPIGKDLHTQMTIFPAVRSVSVAAELPEGSSVQALAFTSADSWAETDLSTLEQEKRSTFDPQRDRQGPISIAAAVTVQNPGDTVATPRTAPALQHVSQARLVVVGDSEFANNSFLTLQGNGDFFLHTVNWLAEEEDLIAIRPRPGGGSGPVLLTAAQEPLIFWVPVVLLPAVVLACGVVVCLTRRWQA
jgi:ABC-type uncharacterized transport system involved in gliding motility auxiliary subunit